MRKPVAQLRKLLALAALLSCTAWAAPTVSLSGSMGADKALLMINGAPRVLAVGQSHQGVRLVSIAGGQAHVEVDGRALTLGLGTTPGRLGDGEAAPNTARSITLVAGPGGHFESDGAINGKATRFLVDTGATNIAMSTRDADRIGLRYRDGRRTTTLTANGPVTAYLLSLDKVRMGEVEIHNVDAVVLPAEMSHILLGNSFLSRFQMKRENDVMVLQLRN